MDKNIKSVQVDIDPKNETEQGFYLYHHALCINKYWFFWDDIQVVLNDQEPSHFPNDQLTSDEA